MAPKRLLSVFCVSFVVLIFAFHKPSQALAIGQWALTGSMLSGTGGINPLIKLPNDKVIAIGNQNNNGGGISQLYDSSTAQWTQTGSILLTPRSQYNPVLLDNGKVLIAGGEPGGGGVYFESELYDFTTETWSTAGNLNQARSSAPLIKLHDGRVLIISGDTHGSGWLNSSELYNPSTDHWELSGNLEVPIQDNEGGNAVLLDDGRVLKVGATGGFSSTVTSTVAEVYNPSTGTWSRTGDLLIDRYSTKLLKLQNGKVIMISGSQWTNLVAECEIYDPETGQWSQAAPLNFARQAHQAILLPDGRVLVAGGISATGGTVLESEIYDPGTNIWTVDAPLNVGRNGGRMVLLTNNDVLMAGGFTESGATTTAEVYSFKKTATFNVSSDTYIQSGQNNRNKGGGDYIHIQASGNNRGLLRFDQDELQQEIADGEILSAKIRLTITETGNNWGSTGRTIDLHRLIVDWIEGDGTEVDRGTGEGTTWNCATDSNINNQSKDCSGVTEWEMGQPNNPSVHPWVQTASATQTITNDQTGIVEFDVTDDIALFLDGTSSNYGWIMKKTEEGQSGQVRFATRESASIPQLVVTYQP
jgi:N-acetylneuraminic acid mutarotase